MKKSNMKMGILILKLIFIVLGLAMTAGAIIAGIHNKKFFRNAEHTTAVITEIGSTRYTRNGETEYKHTVYVTYEVDGVQYNKVRLGYYNSGMYEGKTIKVYYNKDNPGKIKTRGSSMVISIILGVLGGVFLLIGIILVIVFMPRNKKVKQYGIRYEADIINITMNRNVRVNGRHPYIVDCQVVDDFTGVTSLYRSKNIYEDIDVYGIVKVPVYVDQNNPSKYYVDIDEAIERAKKYNNIRDFR